MRGRRVLKRFGISERGATAIEYGLIAALISVVIIAALRLTGARTKKEVVHEALRELVRLRRRRSLMDLRGKVRLARGYDYKKARSGR